MDHTDEIKTQEEFRHIKTISGQGEAEETGCCGGDGCGCASDAETREDNLPAHELGVGIGLPAEYIPLKEGDIVVDLGSGNGNDAFNARQKVGTTGKVIGIEMNDILVDRSRRDAEMAGYNNVEFRAGLIENPPVNDESAKAVISNCLLSNTVDKERVMSEAYRILKHHGHLSFSDIVTDGPVPEGFRLDAQMYLGCSAGAMDAQECLELIADTGFEDVRIADMRPIALPEAMLNYYLKDEEMDRYRSGDFGFYAMTVVAGKPCCKTGKTEEENVVMEHDHSTCGCGGEHCGH
jgi:SAM-dependent methyltransferase